MPEDLVKRIDAALVLGKKVMVAGDTSSLRGYNPGSKYSMRYDLLFRSIIHIEPVEEAA